MPASHLADWVYFGSKTPLAFDQKHLTACGVVQILFPERRAAMRIFAVSDIHIDYDENARWVANLSISEYQDDLLILAGDVTDTRQLLDWCLCTLVKRFRKVLFVPGNHDLWVIREEPTKDSLQKFNDVRMVVESSGASMQK